jgi:hypothetical protein
MPHVGDGSTILLWEDVWNDLSPMTVFPCLFSFAKNKECSVQTFLGNTAMEDNFHTPLSLQAAQEYETFIVIIDQMMASREDSDRWIYPWGNSKFSSLKFYKLNFGSSNPLLRSCGFGSPKYVKRSIFLSGLSSEIESTRRTCSREKAS